jgi:hypothetical protein
MVVHSGHGALPLAHVGMLEPVSGSAAYLPAQVGSD